MTTGQLVFWSGVALLLLTIVLAIVFFIKKPKYIPENAVYRTSADTERLRRTGKTGGRDTALKTSTARPSAAAQTSDKTELLDEQATELIGSAAERDMGTEEKTELI